MIKKNTIFAKKTNKLWTLFIPGSGGFEYICPGIRVEELGLKMRRKIRVFESRRVVLLDEVENLRLRSVVPPVPQPLAVLAESGDGEDPPVDEDPDLSVVVPLGQRSGVQTGPVRLVARCASWRQQGRD